MEESIVKNGEVEVSSLEEGYKGAWFTAILQEDPTKSDLKKLSVRYLTLLKDDRLTPLTETVDESLIRPVPPVDLYNGVVLEEGTVVDANHNDGWWTGVVLKILEAEDEKKKFLVYFDSPPDIFKFERNQLRAHFDWVDSKWVRPEVKELDRSEFSSGTMVEVRTTIDQGEKVWFPAVIIKEIAINTKKTFMVKDCKRLLSCNGDETKPNTIVDSRRVRPKPPSSPVVEKYKLMECVEVFRRSVWRQCTVIRVLSEERYMVRFKATKQETDCKHSDLRLLQVWEDGVWRKEPEGNTIRETVFQKKPSRSFPNAKCRFGISK